MYTFVSEYVFQIKHLNVDSQNYGGSFLFKKCHDGRIIWFNFWNTEHFVQLSVTMEAIHQALNLSLSQPINFVDILIDVSNDTSK